MIFMTENSLEETTVQYTPFLSCFHPFPLQTHPSFPTNTFVNIWIIVILSMVFSLPRVFQSLYDYPLWLSYSYKELSPVVLRSPEDPQPHGTFHDSANIFVQRVHVRWDESVGGGVESLGHVRFKLAERRKILLIDLLTGALFKVLVIACIWL